MMKLTDADLAKIRIETLKLAHTHSPGATIEKAEVYEEWILRAPKPGLIERITSTLGVTPKNK